MRILLTRPLDQARVTARRLEAAGHTVILAPMLTIETLPAPPIDPAGLAGIVVTSPRAVAVLAGRLDCADLLSLPVLAVGARTGEAMTRVGFADVASADGDAEDLAALVVGRWPALSGTVLYPCGRDRGARLERKLGQAGYDVRAVELYAAHQCSTVPRAAMRDLTQGRVDVVLVYSRRTAEAFVNSLRAADIAMGALTIIAISAAAAQPLVDAGCRVLVAAQVDENSILARLNDLG